MVAARLNHVSATKQLLMNGANPEVTVSGDLGNHSAVSLAKESGNVFIAEMIEASM